LFSQRLVDSKIKTNSRFSEKKNRCFCWCDTGAKRRRHQAPKAPSAAGAKRRRRAAVWLTTGSSWPKRSEGSRALTRRGVYMCSITRRGEATVKCVCVCVCVCVGVCGGVWGCVGCVGVCVCVQRIVEKQ
jgi:hypothetical protein